MNFKGGLFYLISFCSMDFPIILNLEWPGFEKNIYLCITIL